MIVEIGYTIVAVIVTLCFYFIGSKSDERNVVYAAASVFTGVIWPLTLAVTAFLGLLYLLGLILYRIAGD